MNNESPFTGVEVIEVDQERIDKLYKSKELELDTPKYPNLFIVAKNIQGSALVRVDSTGLKAKLISDKLKAGKIKPRNKEQAFALDILLDDTVPINIITGRSGSGKTLLSLAAAIEKIEAGKYEKIILTKPMSQVGRYSLGSLPGTVDEKFMPFLDNFETNLSQIGAGRDLTQLMARYNIECKPLQLMRGSSFKDTLVIADEVQVLEEKEMLTLGTRVGEGSKLILLGDLQQIDAPIKGNRTGLHKLFHNELAKNSPLVGAINLIKSERSPVCSLFSDIFEE